VQSSRLQGFVTALIRSSEFFFLAILFVLFLSWVCNAGLKGECDWTLNTASTKWDGKLLATCM
jgi:hypothetical protein